MVGTLKRAIQKVVVRNNDCNWDDCLAEIFGGYRRWPRKNKKSSFEILFGIRPRFAFKPTQLDLVAFSHDLAREFEFAIAKSARVSRMIPRVAEKWTSKFKVGQNVIVQRGRKERGSKIESTNWHGPFFFKEENHTRYQLRTDNRRKFRRPTHAKRLKPYIERDYGPHAGSTCWYRNYAATSSETNKKI